MTDGLVPRELRDAIRETVRDWECSAFPLADAVVAIIEAHTEVAGSVTAVEVPATVPVFRFLSEPKS